MKIRRNILVIFASLLLIFVLGGCGASQSKSNADKSVYKTPMGETGHVAEIRFDNFQVASLDPNTNEKVLNPYFEASKTYTLNFDVYASKEGKKIQITFGSLDGETFTELKASELYEVESIVEEDGTIKYNSFTYEFTTPDSLENIKLAIKLSFGTEFEQDEKAFRKTQLKIKKFELVDNDDDTKKYNVLNTKQDVHYINTAYTHYSTLEETGEVSLLTVDLASDTSFWNRFIATPLGKLTYFLSKLCGGYYWIGLLLLTLILRTAAWPIYAKTNDMSLKMGLMQPELERLNRKYEGRTDQISLQKKQMETMQLYKKYKVNVFGCLLPFLQMPIFIAVYQVVQRFPLTPQFKGLNYNFLWTSFAASASGKVSSDWILAIIVGITMVGLQIFQQQIQKRMNNLNNKKYQSETQQKSGRYMQIFMYVMSAMMVYIAWGSAGIAFYWIVGNMYQFFQTYISQITQKKRREKLKESYSRR